MKLLFVDTETTGLDFNVNGLIQIAGIIEIDGKIKEEFDFRCNIMPGQMIADSALKVTGKTREQIAAYPDSRDVFNKLRWTFDKYIDRFNKKDKFHMVGQNIHFDYGFLNKFFLNHGNQYFYAYVNYHLIDTLAATALFSLAGHFDLPDMKLATVAEHFGIKLDAHDALNDIRVTREILYKYIDMVKGVKI